MVGGMVPGRRARRRRIRGAAHLLREDRARRGSGDALLPGGALRASSLAMDHYGARDRAALSPRRDGEWRARPRGSICPGLRGSPADRLARVHARWLCRRVYVHRGHTAELGRLLPRERFLPTLFAEDRFRAALRERLALGNGWAFPPLHHRDVATRDRRAGVEVPHWA